jgi:hypothetical protein
MVVTVIGFRPCLIILLRQPQPRLDHCDVRFRRLDALGRFLLESVEHINHLGKAHRVNRAIGVALMILDHLEHPAAIALPRLGMRMLPTQLRDAQRIAHRADHGFGEGKQILLRRTDPVERRFAGH